MGKRGPKPNPDKVKAKMIRLPPDMADMLSIVCVYTRVTSAQFFETHLREPLEKEFEAIRPILEQVAENVPGVRAMLDTLDESRRRAAEIRAKEAAEATGETTPTGVPIPPIKWATKPGKTPGVKKKKPSPPS